MALLALPHILLDYRGGGARLPRARVADCARHRAGQELHLRQRAPARRVQRARARGYAPLRLGGLRADGLPARELRAAGAGRHTLRRGRGGERGLRGALASDAQGGGYAERERPHGLRARP